jgi:hypothetical protein
MSFNNHDTNNHINLGNYEEFFILYMDNELTAEQMEMVDYFLSAHPDLQSEFELLMSTRLTPETFSISKEDLMADSMKIELIDEDLLLYLDKELSPEQSRVVELELASNPSYKAQHTLLLTAQLDTAETISYPNKEELYHRTERRIVAFRPWMRVAAAAILLLSVSGVVYFGKQGLQNGTGPTVAATTSPVKQTAPASDPVLNSGAPVKNNEQAALPKTVEDVAKNNEVNQQKAGG